MLTSTGGPKNCTTAGMDLGGISTYVIKVKWYMKPGTQSTIQSLLIPYVDNNGATTWTNVSYNDKVHSLLIERNTRKLSMSKT